jgi:hypothetical protein
MLPTQFIPDFFDAEYYGLRNTIFWGSYRISHLEMSPTNKRGLAKFKILLRVDRIPVTIYG